MCLIAFALSVFIGKYDKLAAILLAIFLLLTMFMIFLKGVSANDQTATTMFLKDLGLVGGALMYAHGFAKDNSIIG